MKGKRTLLLLLMLASTAVLISTATYAWFTANRTVTVNPIQVNIEAQGGIQLSVDGTNWTSIISVADINDAHLQYIDETESINQIPTLLEPVSSGLTMDTDGLMEMWYGIVETNDPDGDYILTATQTTETRGSTGRFVAFDLFFRVDEDETLYLTANSNVETPDATDTGIKNSTRVAFVDLGNTAIGSPLATIQGLNAGAAAPVYVWEPNYDSHTAAAIAHAMDVYGLTVADDDDTAVPYSGVIAEIVTLDDVLLGDATEAENAMFFADVTTNYRTKDGFDTAIQVFNLPAGISKVRFYMWVEGQDVDCENLASGGNVIFNVQFTIDAP